MLHSFPLVSSGVKSLQTKRARLFHCCHQFLVEHREGWVGWKVQAVKASVSPVEMLVKKELLKWLFKNEKNYFLNNPT